MVEKADFQNGSVPMAYATSLDMDLVLEGSGSSLCGSKCLEKGSSILVHPPIGSVTQVLYAVLGIQRLVKIYESF